MMRVRVTSRSNGKKIDSEFQWIPVENSRWCSRRGRWLLGRKLGKLGGGREGR
jgi:hypothetical protein